jgi:D-alanyl-D-alanine dipeptidase
MCPRRKVAAIRPPTIRDVPFDRSASVRRRWRTARVAAIGRQGFVNYSKLWWHFFAAGAGGAAYDFAIQPRRH